MVATLKTSVVQEPSSGTANLTLDASGGVTVGQNLTVTGTTTFTGGSTFTGNATAAAFIPSGSTVPTNGLYLPAANSAGIATASTERLRIDSSGNVGIGTTSPGTLLHIQSSAPSFRAQETSANAVRGLFSAASTGVYVTTDYVTTGIPIIFGTGGVGAAATERMRIDSSGNVGIGTTTPSAKLHVESAGTNYIYTRNSAASGTAGIIFQNTTDTRSWIINGTNFDAYDNSATATRMRIDINGNVGIGTASPANNAGYQTLTINGTSGGVAQIQVAGTNTFQIFSNATANYLNGQTLLPMAFYTNATERMRIDTSGNLLVGTSTAGATVTVYHAGNQKSADFYAVGNASGTTVMSLRKGVNDATTANVYVQFLYNNGGTGAGQINGNGGSQAAFGSYSDVRLKENIQPLSGELEKVCSLRPVEFDYKDGNGHQIGFIAQEVQTIYPDVVSVGENEMLTVTGWNKTEARLVQAIKELKAELDALKTKVGA